MSINGASPYACWLRSMSYRCFHKMCSTHLPMPIGSGRCRTAVSIKCAVPISLRLSAPVDVVPLLTKCAVRISLRLLAPVDVVPVFPQNVQYASPYAYRLRSMSYRCFHKMCSTHLPMPIGSGRCRTAVSIKCAVPISLRLSAPVDVVPLLTKCAVRISLRLLAPVDVVPVFPQNVQYASPYAYRLRSMSYRCFHKMCSTHLPMPIGSGRCRTAVSIKCAVPISLRLSAPVDVVPLFPQNVQYASPYAYRLRSMSRHAPCINRRKTFCLRAVKGLTTTDVLHILRAPY